MLQTFAGDGQGHPQGAPRANCGTAAQIGKPRLARLKRCRELFEKFLRDVEELEGLASRWLASNAH